MICVALVRVSAFIAPFLLKAYSSCSCLFGGSEFARKYFVLWKRLIKSPISRQRAAFTFRHMSHPVISR